MATKPIKFLELHYTMTQFLIKKIIQVYERYDGWNKMQIEQLLKLFHIQGKEIGNNRTWKMAKWNFAWIMTLERKWKTQGWMP